MRDRELVGAFLLGLVLWPRRRLPIEGWIWPVPDTDDESAMISNPFRSPAHMGVDIMYGSGRSYWAPSDAPVISARDGRVIAVGQTARGWHVTVAHRDVSTFYQHLNEVEVAEGDEVRAGQRLGVMGIDPTDPQRVRHLHFEVWPDGRPSSAVNPAGVLSSAGRQRWTR